MGSKPKSLLDRLEQEGYALPHAVGSKPLFLQFIMSCPEFRGDGCLDAQRRYFADRAHQLVDLMVRHLPGGLVDAVFGELALRKASVFIVSHEHGSPTL